MGESKEMEKREFNGRKKKKSYTGKKGEKTRLPKPIKWEYESASV